MQVISKLIIFVLNKTNLNLDINISDTELIDKLRKWDIEAFYAVFEKYSSRLYSFALRYLKPKEAEAQGQDVFLKIRENRKNLKKESPLKSYLITISDHNICRFFRKKQLQGKLNDEICMCRTSTVNTEKRNFGDRKLFY